MAQVACDVFQLLIAHWEHLQRLEPTLLKKIIEVSHIIIYCMILIFLKGNADQSFLFIHVNTQN